MKSIIEFIDVVSGSFGIGWRAEKQAQWADKKICCLSPTSSGASSDFVRPLRLFFV
jgi:hypothetical protein